MSQILSCLILSFQSTILQYKLSCSLLVSSKCFFFLKFQTRKGLEIKNTCNITCARNVPLAITNVSFQNNNERTKIHFKCQRPDQI